MAVYSSPLGGVRLTQEDAKAFREQIVAQPAKKEASIALEEGRQLMEEFKKHGFVSLRNRLVNKNGVH